MARLGLYQLPCKLRLLRQQRGASQSGFAASIGMDPSRWCAIEKGRKRFTTSQALSAVLERVQVDETSRRELLGALEHDLVVDQVERTSSPPEVAWMVSACLQAASMLTQQERQGLLITIESVLASKRELDALSRRGKS